MKTCVKSTSYYVGSWDLGNPRFRSKNEVEICLFEKIDEQHFMLGISKKVWSNQLICPATLSFLI